MAEAKAGKGHDDASYPEFEEQPMTQLPPYEGGPLHSPGPGRTSFDFMSKAPEGQLFVPATVQRSTRYYLDTEFIDDGTTIDLISIGIVCEDGRELYLQSIEFEADKASPWVQENVYPHLNRCAFLKFGHVPEIVSLVNLDKGMHRQGHNTVDSGSQVACPWRTREQIRNEVVSFLGIKTFDLYGWCSAYDFVAFTQLFGTMMDLPGFYPHYINDLQQELDKHGISDDQLPPQAGTAHNALDDARYIKHLWGVVCGHYADKIEGPILPPYEG